MEKKILGRDENKMNVVLFTCETTKKRKHKNREHLLYFCGSDTNVF